jgi:hypothetical protein
VHHGNSQFSSRSLSHSIRGFQHPSFVKVRVRKPDMARRICNQTFVGGQPHQKYL